MNTTRPMETLTSEEEHGQILVNLRGVYVTFYWTPGCADWRDAGKGPATSTELRGIAQGWERLEIHETSKGNYLMEAFTRENTNGEFDEGELKFLNMLWNEQYSNLKPDSPRGRAARDRCIMELTEAQEADRCAGS